MSVRIKNQIGDTGSHFFKLLKIMPINYPMKINRNSLTLEYLRLKINILQKISDSTCKKNCKQQNVIEVPCIRRETKKMCYKEHW